MLLLTLMEFESKEERTFYILELNLNSEPLSALS